jgi:hypothetical protein
MFLTAADLTTLTGRRRRTGQIAALRAMGVPFLVNAIGWPVVTRSAIEGREAAATPPVKRAWQPTVLQQAA